MPIYRVTVSAERISNPLDSSNEARVTDFFEFEADDDEQAAVEAADVWRKRTGAADRPQFLGVQRVDSASAEAD